MPIRNSHSLPHVDPAPGTRCTLLLGTDAHIKEGTPDQERRVAVTPAQLGALRGWLADAGVECQLLFVAGAGERAGFPDADFERVGARAVPEAELASLEAAPDVVHALKEPCAYESTIPGPFLRIGALHTGDHFDPGSDSARLLCSRRACAVFDGSEIGGHAFRFTDPPGFPVPIRSSMSVFAGEIAAADVVTHLDGRSGRCVIAGGGAAGTAAAEWLLRNAPAARVLVMDALAPAVARLRARFADEPRVEVVEGEWLTGEMLDGAEAVILAVFAPGDLAPRVVGRDELSHLAQGALVIDISIDEGGAIAGEDAEGAEAGDPTPPGYRYMAETNMPRRRPGEASRAHGAAVLPYLAVLLYLSAKLGGAKGAMAHIARLRLPDMDRTATDAPEDYFGALVQDLRHGTAFWGVEEVHVNRDAVRQWERYEALLRERGVPVSGRDAAQAGEPAGL